MAAASTAAVDSPPGRATTAEMQPAMASEEAYGEQLVGELPHARVGAADAASTVLCIYATVSADDGPSGTASSPDKRVPAGVRSLRGGL